MAMTAYYNDNDPFCCEWLRNLIDAGELPPGDVECRSITEVTADELRRYTQCHFFCGVGGWPLALRLAGWDATEPVWTGSCPCQPFSSAGKRQGEKDERHLWPEFIRLTKGCRPQTVFGEQVASSEIVGTQLEAAFVIAVQNGDYARANLLAKRLAQSNSFHYWARWVDRVQADLAGTDYTLGFKVLGAHSVGAPHIRQRLYWVADTERTEPRPGNGQEREAGVGRDRLAEYGDACGLGNTPSYGRQQGRAEPDGRGTASGCGIGGLGNHISPRLEGRQSQPGDDGPQQPTAERASRDACGLGNTTNHRTPGSQQAGQPETERGSATAWSDFTIVHCRDGKARRIPTQREFQPLAHGIQRKLGPELAGLAGMVRSARRNRVGRLRGYGNAICIPVAVEFIKAYRGTTE